MRERHALETVGWLIVGAVLAVVILLLYFGGPQWLVATLFWVIIVAALPLMFADVRRSWREMSGYAAVLGPIRSWAVIVGTIAFILLFAGADIWLSDKIGWPEAYGFACHGRGCWIANLSHSPQLLKGGSEYELGLFALLWLLPAFVVCGAVFAIIKRLLRNSIQPMD